MINKPKTPHGFGIDCNAFHSSSV